VRDGRLRRAVKAVALLGFRANLAAWRGWRKLRGDRPYRLGGSCHLCAQCCEAPAIKAGRLVWFLPSQRKLFLWWQRAVNGFELVSKDVRHRTFVFRCTHFDPATRRCDSYASRPGMCRDYPRILLDQAHPKMLPGCGYRPIAPRAEQLLSALRRLPLTEDQDARLRKDLHLDA
jgi:Fe-S-cluster containining protein